MEPAIKVRHANLQVSPYSRRYRICSKELEQLRDCLTPIRNELFTSLTFIFPIGPPTAEHLNSIEPVPLPHLEQWMWQQFTMGGCDLEKAEDHISSDPICINWAYCWSAWSFCVHTSCRTHSFQQSSILLIRLVTLGSRSGGLDSS